MTAPDRPAAPRTADPRAAFGETTPADAAGWDEALAPTAPNSGDQPPDQDDTGPAPIGDDPTAPGGGHGEGP